MFRKKQLNVNIKDLDLQISKLSKELEELEQDSKYETTMAKLKDLTELRVSLAKSLKDNAKNLDSMIEMDKQIEELTAKLDLIERNDKYSEKLSKLEALTKVRCQLAESKVNGSIKPVVISGLFGLTSVLIVLKYEETEVITSKAFNMATSMFRGNR